MAIDEFSLSSEAKRIIEAAGYKLYGSMDAQIQEWYQWYTTSYDGFYKVPYIVRVGNEIQHKSRPRYSLKPAKRVCREYASLILTEDTEIAAEAPNANQWLQGYLSANNFWPNGQNLIERAFAIGTGGWFLDFDIRDAAEDSRIRAQRYDARMIKPLSWDVEGITECATADRITHKGKPVERLVLYVLDQDTGTYHLRTHLVQDGKELTPEALGYIADFDTRSHYKPFGIVTPGIDNTVADFSPYGMSIFADAVDSIKAVDLAFDSLFREVDLTQVKIFMDEALVDVDTQSGKAIPLTETDQQTFRMIEGQNANHLIDIFSPNIRTEPLRQALNVALAELGEACGFGQNYFTLDKAGGLKTATEVVADNGALMRNVKKHENVVRGAIQDVMSALLDNARIHCAASTETEPGSKVSIEQDFGPISVKFDDSVITDTQTAKNQMLAEIAAGVRPKWHFLVEFDGKSKEEALAELPQEAIIDPGF